MTHPHCRECGTTDPTRFGKRGGAVCMRCRARIRRGAEPKLAEAPLYTYRGSNADSKLTKERETGLRTLATGDINPVPLDKAIRRLENRRQELWRLQATAPDPAYAEQIKAITSKLEIWWPRLRAILARRRRRLNPRADDRLPEIVRVEAIG